MTLRAAGSAGCDGAYRTWRKHGSVRSHRKNRDDFGSCGRNGRTILSVQFTNAIGPVPFDAGYSTTIIYAISLVVVTVHLVPYVVDQGGIKSIPGPWFAKFTDVWLDRVASEAKGGRDMKKAGGETTETRPTANIVRSDNSGSSVVNVEIFSRDPMRADFFAETESGAAELLTVDPTRGNLRDAKSLYCLWMDGDGEQICRSARYLDIQQCTHRLRC